MLKFKTHGKWILAGEHAVLRGSKAMVFPVGSKYLEFSYEESDEPLSLEIIGENKDFEMAFWGVLERALQSVGATRAQLKGHITFKSDIPVGAGMGASATLCVSLAKWFTHLSFLDESKQYEFAKSLEDIFHGESSGVDVAVALSGQGLEFQKPNYMKNFVPSWKPHFYLSYCGTRGVTADCIQKVNKLIEEDPEKAAEIDQQMIKAVELASQSLLSHGDMTSLQEAITLAEGCFESWGLMSHDLKNHILELKKLGAVATKPTGSGDGGFVLSLWPQKQNSKYFPFELIEV